MRFVPLLFVAACTSDPTLSEVDFAVKCAPYGCGENSPETEGTLFWAQNEDGVPNDQGIRITGFQGLIGGVLTPLHADVRDAELLGRNIQTNAIVIEGGQLVGSIFTLHDDVAGLDYFVKVEGAGEIPMWAQAPNAGAQSWNYVLTYTSSINANPRNLCKAAGAPTGDPMDPFHAVLFDDDRIDTDAKTVEAEEANWFTIGCAGSALAKLHLTAHTKAGSNLVGHTTTLEQRTAFLKMLVADYCGNGDALTTAGMDLHYRDVNGHMNSSVYGEQVEALWTSAGAICMNTPRVDFNLGLPASPLGSSILDEIACPLPPPCRPTTYGPRYPFGHGYAMSTNY